MARIRTIKPDDRISWKLLGTCGPSEQYVYRLYRADGALLYVGVTWNPYTRWSKHARSKAWWPEVSSVRLSKFTTDQARSEEARAIYKERPLHNIKLSRGAGVGAH